MSFCILQERQWRRQLLYSVLRLAWFDLKQELSPPVPIFLQWLTFLLQLLVYGALISRLVVAMPDYLQFYAIGYLIILVFDVATIAGRRFVEHGNDGRLRYLLSLPFPRWKLYLATGVAGGLWLALTISIPFAVTLALVSNLSAVSIVGALASLFLLGFGVSGVMLALSFVAFRSPDVYLATTTGLNALAIRFSSVLYPLILLPGAYAVAALFSPLTYGADIARLLLGISVGSPLDPTLEASILVALLLFAIVLGGYLLERLVEGVKSG